MRLAFVFVVSIALASVSSRSAAQGADDPVADFDARIAAYVSMHRQIERFVPRQKDTTDPVEARSAVSAMATAIRAMRPEAREGDVFTTAIAIELRARTERALVASGLNAGALIDEMRANTEDDARPVVVNESFSWALGNLMPPAVLLALPELPEELQYRFVERDLVLLDVHANLVVDVLRDALPEESRANFRKAAVRTSSRQPPGGV